MMNKDLRIAAKSNVKTIASETAQLETDVAELKAALLLHDGLHHQGAAGVRHVLRKEIGGSVWEHGAEGKLRTYTSASDLHQKPIAASTSHRSTRPSSAFGSIVAKDQDAIKQYKNSIRSARTVKIAKSPTTNRQANQDVLKLKSVQRPSTSEKVIPGHEAMEETSLNKQGGQVDEFMARMEELERQEHRFDISGADISGTAVAKGAQQQESSRKESCRKFRESSRNNNSESRSQMNISKKKVSLVPTTNFKVQDSDYVNMYSDSSKCVKGNKEDLPNACNMYSDPTGCNIVSGHNVKPACDPEVLKWLQDLNLKDLNKYSAIFAKHELDLESVQLMNEKQLKSIGITAVGPLTKLMHGIRQLRNKKRYDDLSSKDDSKMMCSGSKKTTIKAVPSPGKAKSVLIQRENQPTRIPSAPSKRSNMRGKKTEEPTTERRPASAKVHGKSSEQLKPKKTARSELSSDDVQDMITVSAITGKERNHPVVNVTAPKHAKENDGISDETDATVLLQAIQQQVKSLEEYPKSDNNKTLETILLLHKKLENFQTALLTKREGEEGKSERYIEMPKAAYLPAEVTDVPKTVPPSDISAGVQVLEHPDHDDPMDQPSTSRTDLELASLTSQRDALETPDAEGRGTRQPDSGRMPSAGGRRSTQGTGPAVASRAMSRQQLLSQVRKQKQQHRRQIRNLEMELNRLRHNDPLKNCEVNPNDVLFNEEDLLGEGSFSKVYRGCYQGTDVAVKRLKLPLLAQDKNYFAAEVGLLRELRHPRVTLLLGVCTTGQLPLMVLEFMARGSLYHYLHNQDNPWLDHAAYYRVASDVALGMNYLHRHKPAILHLDLKSMNVLLAPDLRAKIADFGFSKLRYDAEQQKSKKQKHGSPAWMSPELLESGKVSTKADVYSYGIVMWEMLTREVPYEGSSLFQIIDGVKKKQRPPLPDDCPAELAALIQACWHQNPTARPAFKDVLVKLEQLTFPPEWREVLSSASIPPEVLEDIDVARSIIDVVSSLADVPSVKGDGDLIDDTTSLTGDCSVGQMQTQKHDQEEIEVQASQSPKVSPEEAVDTNLTNTSVDLKLDLRMVATPPEKKVQNLSLSPRDSVDTTSTCYTKEGSYRNEEHRTGSSDHLTSVLASYEKIRPAVSSSMCLDLQDLESDNSYDSAESDGNNYCEEFYPKDKHSDTYRAEDTQPQSDALLCQLDDDNVVIRHSVSEKKENDDSNNLYESLKSSLLERLQKTESYLQSVNVSEAWANPDEKQIETTITSPEPSSGANIPAAPPPPSILADAGDPGEELKQQKLDIIKDLKQGLQQLKLRVPGQHIHFAVPEMAPASAASPRVSQTKKSPKKHRDEKKKLQAKSMPPERVMLKSWELREQRRSLKPTGQPHPSQLRDLASVNPVRLGSIAEVLKKAVNERRASMKIDQSMNLEVESEPSSWSSSNITE